MDSSLKAFMFLAFEGQPAGGLASRRPQGEEKIRDCSARAAAAVKHPLSLRTPG
jgi:hypothetical protein